MALKIDWGLAVLGEHRASPLSRRLRGERHKDCTSIHNDRRVWSISNGCVADCPSASTWSAPYRQGVGVDVDDHVTAPAREVTESAAGSAPPACRRSSRAGTPSPTRRRYRTMRSSDASGWCQPKKYPATE